MQAQQRGKKRSAETMGSLKNVTAGGKRAKKEVGEEKPKPPFVCAIYRRDIASFLPRAKIQQWRQTSSRSNASLIEFPFRLPRFKYHSLTVIFANAERCRAKKDGFLHNESDGYTMQGREFNSIFKFRFCCCDVKDRASELANQRLFPNKPDDEGVAFQLYVDGRGTSVMVCRVRNLLTKKTALAMLHFLHHLSQACFEHVEIYSGATRNAPECAFNPLVMQALPKFQLRGVKLGSARYGGQLSNLTVKMASEMRIRFNLLYNCSYSLGQLLDFIANGRQLAVDKRLEYGGYLNSQSVDQIIKYFVEHVHSLEGAIRDVRFKCICNWPARCPREAATQVTEMDQRTVEHRFDFTNAHSKEPFSLLLETHSDEKGTLNRRFKLAFGSL